jgi:hypothetical protein
VGLRGADDVLSEDKVYLVLCGVFIILHGLVEVDQSVGHSVLQSLFNVVKVEEVLKCYSITLQIDQGFDVLNVE